MEGEDPGKTPPSLDSSDLKWNNEASPGTLRGISKWSPSLGMTADPQVSLEVLPENPGLTGREEGGLVRGERDGRQMIRLHSEGGPLEESPVSWQLEQLQAPSPLSDFREQQQEVESQLDKDRKQLGRKPHPLPRQRRLRSTDPQPLTL